MILKKISIFGTTGCQILSLKCTKFNFRWGSAPDPAVSAYSAPPSPLAVFKGPTSKGREEEGKGEKGKGRGMERTTLRTPCRKFLATPLSTQNN